MIQARIRSAPGGTGDWAVVIGEKDTLVSRTVTIRLGKIRPRKNKGPRNGPDPRGAGKLNRFRERLDGRRGCVAGIELEATAGIHAAVGLRAGLIAVPLKPSGGGTVGRVFLGVNGVFKVYSRGFSPKTPVVGRLAALS